MKTMHRCLRALPIVLLPLAAACDTLDAWQARWEGLAEIPGAAQPVVLDLTRREGRLHAWLTLPGRGTKGLQLVEPQVEGDALRIDMSAAFSQAGAPKPAPMLRLQRPAPAGSELRGEWQQAGLAAPLRLTRTGAPQPEPLRANTPLSSELRGVWRGSYEIAGVPRQVTLTLGRTSAEMLIEGRRTVKVSLDDMRQTEHYLRLGSALMGLTLEGPWRTPSGAIELTLLQGPFELPLVLRREVRP